MSDSLWPYGLKLILCPWDSLGKNTEMGCHALLQGNPPNPGMEPLYLKSSELAGRFFISSATCVHPLPLLYIVWDWGGQSDFQILRLETPALGSEGHPPPSSSLPG